MTTGTTRSTMPASDAQRAWLLLAGIALAWGINWPVGKALLAYLPPIWVVALRSAVGAAALLVICVLRKRLVLPKRGDIPVILSVGVLHMTAFSVLASIGLQYVAAGRSAVLAYTTPLWVVPGAWLMLGEPMTVRRLAGVGLGLLGLLLIFNPLAFDWRDRNAVLGNGLVLLAALCWAISILYVRAHKWVTPPFELVFWQALLATCLLIPLALLLDGMPQVDWQPSLAGLLLYGGFFGIALAYWAMNTVNRTLPAATTSLGLLGVPVFGVACSAIALGEPISLQLIVAMGLILGGIGVGTMGGGRQRG
ncbi:DMT family transporter [Cupriavidus metallidurans]|uniref:DMT family transporter n=1 Tax=Cupriavidus metallidurans TaxID=119219 RepID=UPI0009B8239F|nr:DMT family transporter [Cupriavidus metallidurans]